MKNTITVGLFGKLHGLTNKLNRDLHALGFTPLEIDSRAFACPPNTAAVICTISDQRPSEDQRGEKELNELSQLIASLKNEQVHLIYVSIAGSNRPEAKVTDFGHLDLQAEDLIRAGRLPYTIVRAMSADDRQGQNHKIYWKQSLQGSQNGQEHPIPWEDLSQVLVHCVNRESVLSKTFMVHSVAGEPVDNWDEWFRGLNPDSKQQAPHKKTA